MNNNKKERHPSYALLSFSRTHSSGNTNLFGSSIKHNNTITMRVNQASINRTLNSDWYMNEGTLLEVEMSQTQFAEAITSLNCGEGIPVTLKYFQTKGNIEDCPFTDKKEQFQKEFKSHLDKTMEDTNSLIEKLSDRFADTKGLTKKEKENILSTLIKISQNIGCNTEFIYKQFNNQMDKTVNEAKGEIEAFYENRVVDFAKKAILEEENKRIENN